MTKRDIIIFMVALLLGMAVVTLISKLTPSKVAKKSAENKAKIEKLDEKIEELEKTDESLAVASRGIDVKISQEEYKHEIMIVKHEEKISNLNKLSADSVYIKWTELARR